MINITGSNGFVGKHLCGHLRQIGIPFKTISRQQILKTQIDFSKNDIIVHLAGVIKNPFSIKIYQGNASLTQALINQAYKSKIKKFIFISSARVLNNYNDPYTWSKLQAELCVKSSQVPYIILRPSVLFGPWDYKNIYTLDRLVKLSPIVPLIHHSIKRQPLYIDDFIHLIAKVIKSPKKNFTVNAIGLMSFSINELIKKIIFLNKMRRVLIKTHIKFVRNEIFGFSNWYKAWHIQPTNLTQGLKQTLFPVLSTQIKHIKLSAIVPVFNEQSTLESLINRLALIKQIKQIIIVNDGSTDNTSIIINKLANKFKHIKTIHYSNNQGKGAAIKVALPYVSQEFTIIQDADSEYHPQDILRLLTPIASFNAQAVYGSRTLGNNPVAHWTFYLGGKLLTFITNLLFNTNLTDQPTGYKLISTQLLKAFQFQCVGFEFCSEVTAKLAINRIRIYEIPISYSPRSLKDGKKIKFRDFFIGIKTLAHHRFINSRNHLTHDIIRK